MTTDVSEDLLKKYHNSAWGILKNLNFIHIRNSAIALFLIDFAMIGVDYLNYARNFWIRNSAYKILFSAHIALGVMMLAYILTYKKSRTNSKKNIIYTQVFIFFLLNISAFISGRVDELLHGEITVFIFMCFFISFFFYQKPLYSILSYTESLTFFIILASITQKNMDTLQSNIGNAVIVAILSCVIQIKISKTVLKYQIYKTNLEEIVDEQTTKLKESMIQVQRLDRLNIVGQLASTVAHEIRNPLTTVRGFLQLLGGKQKGTKDFEFFELMISEIDRANDIIEEFLSISRKKPVVMEVGNIADIVNSVIPLVQADVLNREMNLTIDIQEVTDTYLNPQEIVQLILNLTRNGMDAMKENGLLKIEVYEEDSQIVLAVKDNGTGISSEVLSNIGNPFFTTKDMGTGIGLVVCNSIIERHKGKMTIETSSTGSTFKIFFPITIEKKLVS